MQGHIAYQGNPGGFSEELASSLSPNLQPLPCEKYEDAFLALTSFAADKALVPIENSLGGSIHEILDLLLRSFLPSSTGCQPSYLSPYMRSSTSFLSQNLLQAKNLLPLL